MNNYAKKDLLKMQNLMERMENHMTINEAEQNLKEKLIKEGLEEAEDKHEITTDKFADYTGKIKKGWAVHVGYVTTETLALSRTYPTQKSHDELSAKIGAGVGDKFKDYIGTSLDDMQKFIDNPGKSKTFKFPVKENYEIIKFQEYSMNWMDRESIAAFYKAIGDKELDLRRQSGFGQEGAEDTWRGKFTFYKTGEKAGQKKYAYGGAGLLPQVDKGGNTYTDSNDAEGFQDSWKDPKTGKHALRQKAVAYGEPRYFLHDLNVNSYEEVSKDIVYTLAYKFKQPKVVQELEQDEQAFVDALKNIRSESSAVWKLMEEKCLFITYTLVMPNGSKQPKRLVNQDLKAQLEPIINDLGLRDKLTDL